MTMQVTIAELQSLLQTLHLPTDTQVTITFGEDSALEALLQRQKALLAMKKLRGTGNGRLIKTLLQERALDASR
jgi:hypothetical protein